MPQACADSPPAPHAWRPAHHPLPGIALPPLSGDALAPSPAPPAGSPSGRAGGSRGPDFSPGHPTCPEALCPLLAMSPPQTAPPASAAETPHSLAHRAPLCRASVSPARSSTRQAPLLQTSTWLQSLCPRPEPPRAGIEPAQGPTSHAGSAPRPRGLAASIPPAAVSARPSAVCVPAASSAPGPLAARRRAHALWTIASSAFEPPPGAQPPLFVKLAAAAVADAVVPVVAAAVADVAVAVDASPPQRVSRASSPGCFDLWIGHHPSLSDVSPQPP
mmetsp:Transcript_5542/g.10598  ORF Transcript_5542/g.10598 Transcript_5542/m.10598 type:complete len:275 (-) Transcript_5542:103-927(-)